MYNYRKVESDIDKAINAEERVLRYEKPSA
jgi:hypothetical protein